MAGRYYKNGGGVKVPSVTTVLSLLSKGDAMRQWAANCVLDFLEREAGRRGLQTASDLLQLAGDAKFAWRNESKKATRVGTTLHLAIEDYLREGKPFPTPTCAEEENCFNAAMVFMLENDLTPAKDGLERKLVTDRWGGTCDFIGQFNGDKWLLDWKSSKDFYKEYDYQVAAYASTDPTIVRTGVVRLDKFGAGWELKETTPTRDDDLKVFEAVVNLWWAMKG